MARNACTLILCLVVAWGLGACGAKKIDYKTDLDRLIDSDFVGLETPTPDKVRRGGVSRAYRQTDFGAVWTDCLLLLMQRGVIARASKEMGVIVSLRAPPPVKGPKEANHIKHWINVGFPMVLLVEDPGLGAIVVHANWLEEPFARQDKPAVQAIGIKRSAKERLAGRFFDTLAVQVYAAQKWRYLFH